MAFYTVYKTIDIRNEHYYLGVHKTANPNDSYYGSGTIIRNLLAKHGEGILRKEILFIYPTGEEAYAKEDELVAVFINDPLCYNLRKGGLGGFDYINRNGLHRRALPEVEAENGKRLQKWRAGLSPEERLKLSRDASAHWRGKHHSPSSLEKLSAARKGNNSRQGTRWVYNLKSGQKRLVPADEVDSLITEEWVTGKLKKDKSASNYGKLWINNGTINKLIKPAELADYTGWVRGRLDPFQRHNHSV